MRALIALVMMVGCGGGEGGDALTVDDFVPDQVRAQYGDLPEHVITCVRHQYVSAMRVIECSQDGAQVRFVEEAVNSRDYIASCEGNAYVYTDEIVTQVESCFDAWANADCGELEGPPAPCRMAESWGPPGD